MPKLGAWDADGEATPKPGDEPVDGGGGNEKDEVAFMAGRCCCCWPRERFPMDALTPPNAELVFVWDAIGVLLDDHGLEVTVEEADQLVAVFWAGGGANADCGWEAIAGCSGCENCVVIGASAPKLPRSGVTVLKLPWALTALKLGVAVGCVGLGVDQEKAGAFGVPPRLLTDGDATGGLSSQLENVVLGLISPTPPLTSLSKSSSSPPPLACSNAALLWPPKPIKSSTGTAVVDASPLADSSCNFLVCSSSTRRDSDLMRSMNDWNCFRFRSGPNDMLHRIGSRSIATKSASAACPTTRMTSRAAIITAGSFVLMAFTRGTIFSCIVYLSSAVDDDVFFSTMPANPSSAASGEPPHRMTNARRPRIFICRLFVRAKTAAITGNSSFLMVLKSRTGKMTGKPLSAASTKPCVGDSIAVTMMGSMSTDS